MKRSSWDTPTATWIIFPTIRAAAEGGYGGADSDTYLAVGAGERMLDQALIQVYEMLGRLADKPEDLK